MLEPVKAGEPIKAQQYNELLGALAGPNAPSNGIPFTQTKNGTLLNGGITKYDTKASSRFNDFMSITYSTGTLDDRFEGWEEDDELFDGIWFQIPHYEKSGQYFYHTQFYGQDVTTLLIDPTTEDDDLKLIWILPGSTATPAAMFPLCGVKDEASLGVFQITETDNNYTSQYLGKTIAIFGNWKKLNAAGLGWDTIGAYTGNESKLVSAIKDAQPALRSVLSKVRFVGQYPMYVNRDYSNGENYDLPPVAFNVGMQTIESFPDAAQGYDNELSVTELSSIEFTPAASWGFPSGNQATWGYSLFHFARYASDSLSTVYDEITHQYVPELSAYDVLMRHKHPHSKSNTGNPFYGGQAEAVLEYISLASLIDLLDDVKVDTTETNLAQCSIEKLLSDDNEFLQLYHFNIPGVDNTLHVNLNFGETRWVRADGGSGSYPDPNVQFIIRDSSNNVEVQYDDLGIFLPHVNASDVIDLSTVISDYVHCECSCDLASIWAALSGLSNDLSNYWKVGGSYNDNCYGESIGDDSANPQIDLNNGQLLYSNELDPTVDWHNGYLQWNYGETRIDWPNCVLYDTNLTPSLTWDSRSLLDSNTVATVDWEHCLLQSGGGTIAADWNRRQLWDFNNPTVEWADYKLNGPTGNTSINWWQCKMWDSNNNLAVDWDNRTLSGDWTVQGNLTIAGYNSHLQIGSTTISEAQLIQLLALI